MDPIEDQPAGSRCTHPHGVERPQTRHARAIQIDQEHADDRLVAFGPRAQISLLILLAAAALVVARRRDSFDLGSHL